MTHRGTGVKEEKRIVARSKRATILVLFYMWCVRHPEPRKRSAAWEGAPFVCRSLATLGPALSETKG